MLKATEFESFYCQICLARVHRFSSLSCGMLTSIFLFGEERAAEADWLCFGLREMDVRSFQSKGMEKEVSFLQIILERRFFVDEVSPAVRLRLETKIGWSRLALQLFDVTFVRCSRVQFPRIKERGACSLQPPESAPLAYKVLPSVLKVGWICISNGSIGFELF